MAMFTDQEADIFEEARTANAYPDGRIKCPFCPNKGGCHAGHWEDGERTPVECPHLLSQGLGRWCWKGLAGKAMADINRCFILMSTEDRQDRSLFEGVAIWDENFNDLFDEDNETILAEHHDGIKAHVRDVVVDGEVVGLEGWVFLDPTKAKQVLSDLKRIALRLGARLVFGSGGEDRRMAELAEKEGGEFITDPRDPDFNRETRISYRPPMTKRMDAGRMQEMLDKHGVKWLGADPDHPIWREGITVSVGMSPPLTAAQDQEPARESRQQQQVSDEEATQLFRSWQGEMVRIVIGPQLPSDFLAQIEKVSSDDIVAAVVKQGFGGIPGYMIGNPYMVPVTAIQSMANIDRDIVLSRNGDTWNFSGRS
jgi:hypothetical protein